jgi:hypothetical protein
VSRLGGLREEGICTHAKVVLENNVLLLTIL